MVQDLSDWRALDDGLSQTAPLPSPPGYNADNHRFQKASPGDYNSDWLRTRVTGEHFLVAYVPDRTTGYDGDDNHRDFRRYVCIKCCETN